MKKIIWCLLVALSLTSISPLSHSGENGKSYYVSIKGSDSGTGSREDPFKTIQKAVDTARAGETIYVMDGTYKEAISFKHSGKKDKYITLKALNRGKAHLTLKSGKRGPIIDLNGKSYIRIEGLDIGNVTARECCGIFMGKGVSNVVIQNNKIHDIKTTQADNPDAGCNAILCLGEGSTAESAISHITISGNQIYNNATGWSEAVSIAGNAEYIVVKNNKVYDNTNIGIDFYGNAGYCCNAKLDQPRYCKAMNNTVYNCRSFYAENAGIYVDGARDSQIFNNVVYNNPYGIEIGSEDGYGKDSTTPVTRIKVYGNTVKNNSDGGIRIGGFDTGVSGTVKDSEIYDNTLINNGSGPGGYSGEINIEKTKRIKVYNNVIKKTKASQNKYPMLNIGSDVSKSYIKDLQLFGNKYYTTLKSDKVIFYMFGREYVGLNTTKGMKKGIKAVLKVDMKDKVVYIK